MVTMTAEAWKNFLDGEAAAEKKAWLAKKRKGLPEGLKLPGHDELDPLGTGREDDPMLPVLVALYAEAEQLIAIHKAELARLSVAAPAPAPYGDVFTADNLARYEFWPARESSMPLLAFCARQLLAGVKISSTSNERMHSPSEKILCAVRGRLLPANVEKLTLSFFYVRKEAVERTREWEEATALMSAAQKEAALEELLEKLEVEAMEARDAAAEHGDEEVLEVGEEEEEGGAAAAEGGAAAAAAGGGGGGGGGAWDDGE
jgi:hypothetical protein